MKQPHISTGKHMTGEDPRFRINTAPGVMKTSGYIEEAHGSYLQHRTVIELRDELNAWLKANPTEAELLIRGKAQVWDECLDAIEKHELNTEQARAGNPYRAQLPVTGLDTPEEQLGGPTN